MKLSIKWLSQFIDLEGLTTEDIINTMLTAGLEVESVEHLRNITNRLSKINGVFSIERTGN